MKLSFSYDMMRDIRNWQNSVTSKSYGVDWKKFLPADISEDQAADSKILEAYLTKNFVESGKVLSFIDYLKSVARVEQIQEDLETLVGKKFPPHDISVFITTFHRAPYDVQQRFFFVILREANKKRGITSIYHELMHFLFHTYYWEQCQNAGLSEEQIHALKESATVLLNPILLRRGFPRDNGYAPHQELRGRLERLWKEKWNFQLVLDEILKIDQRRTSAARIPAG